MKALREMLGNRDMLTWAWLEGSVFKDLAEKFLKRSGNGFLSAAYLHVKPGFWANPESKAFLEDQKHAGLHVQATASKFVIKEVEDLVTGEASKLFLIAFAAVFVLIYFNFRSWRLAALSLLPVTLATFWTLGLMGMLKMDLNFMNLIVFTMVLGVGVDYGIHILHRLLESEATYRQASLTQVSKGVVLAALTTLAGFGSLVFSEYPGLQSMGAVALMGVGFSALIALTVVPVLFLKGFPSKHHA